jgi:hypothetical protein
MPFLMDADRAAVIIVAGLARRKGRIAFPLPTFFVAWLLSVLPDRLADWIGRQLPGKG